MIFHMVKCKTKGHNFSLMFSNVYTTSNASPSKISNIYQYRNKSVISRTLFFAPASVSTGSKYIAIKDERLQIIQCPRI